MAEDNQPDESQKTEEATQHKLEEAFKKGQIAVSREVVHWVMLATSAGIVVGLLPFLSNRLMPVLQTYLQNPHRLLSDGFSIWGSIFRISLSLAIPLGMLMIAAIGIGLAQSRFAISTSALAPKFERLSPFKGFSRILGKKALVEFLKGLAKLTIIGTVSYLVFHNRFSLVEQWVTLSPTKFVGVLMGLISTLFLSVLSVLALIALADFTYQWFAHRKSLRMTREEVKREQKDMDGDPIIKQKRRQIQQERSRKRMMQAIPTATAVITNPTHYAIAIKYEEETMDAPVVVAKGLDLIALRIRDIAKENKIPVIENPPLARALYASVDLDQEIPPEHYKAVADVIRIVMTLKKKLF